MQNHPVHKFMLIVASAAVSIISGFGCTQKTTSPASTFTSSIGTTPANSATGTSIIVSSTTPVSSSTVSPIVFQQYKSLAATFHAVLTFNVNNTNVSYPSDFSVPSVPITWSGTSFTGKLQEAGPGEDITDKVSGIISADGKIMVSLTYSRQILRTNNSGTSFSIGLVNLPLSVGTTSGIYSYSGVAIQGYVSEINYADVTIVSGQIIASTTYVSSDWGNIQQPPALKITFGK